MEVNTATSEALCCSNPSTFEDGGATVVASIGEYNVALSSVKAEGGASIRAEPRPVESMLVVFEGIGEEELKAGPMVVRSAGVIDMLTRRSL